MISVKVATALVAGQAQKTGQRLLAWPLGEEGGTGVLQNKTLFITN